MKLVTQSRDLQELGESLLAFNPSKLAALNLPPDLIKALTESKKLNLRKAGRRQCQYIGKLMRELDEETLQAIKQFLVLRKSGR